MHQWEYFQHSRCSIGAVVVALLVMIFLLAHLLLIAWVLHGFLAGDQADYYELAFQFSSCNLASATSTFDTKVCSASVDCFKDTSSWTSWFELVHSDAGAAVEKDSESACASERLARSNRKLQTWPGPKLSLNPLSHTALNSSLVRCVEHLWMFELRKFPERCMSWPLL